MKYDVLTTNEESLSVEVVAGKINSRRFKNITKKSARLFEGKKIYSNSFVGEIPDEELLRKIREEKENVGVGIPFDYQIPESKSLKIEDSESLKIPLTSINESIEVAQEKLAKYSKEFVFNGKFERAFHTRTLTNSNGGVLSRRFALNEWYFLFRKVGSPNLMDGYFAQTSRDLNVGDVLEKNIPYLEAYNHEIKINNGRFPVVFIESNQHGKLAESLLAEKYCEGSALYSGKLGSKLFSSQFSLYDVNYSPAHGNYKKFDGEGTVREFTNLPLVEKGVFKNVIADLRSAKKYGVEATGNGQRNTDTAVSTSFNGLVIGKGSRSTQEILSSLKECIVVFMGHGGDFTDKGDFSTPLQLSYLIKNGNIVGRLPQLTVKATTDEMFGSRLIEIANDGFQKCFQNPSLFCEMDVYVN